MKSVSERLNICSVSEASALFPFGVVPDSVRFSNDKYLKDEFYKRFSHDFYLTRIDYPEDFYSATDILDDFLLDFDECELCMWLD